MKIYVIRRGNRNESRNNYWQEYKYGQHLLREFIQISTKKNRGIKKNRNWRSAVWEKRN